MISYPVEWSNFILQVYIHMSNTIVIKLGGSALSISKDNIFDFDYVKKLKEVFNEFADSKFFLAVGGGYTMRLYRDLAKKNGLNVTNELHWIGTTVNVLHAEIVRAFLHDIADDGVYKYEDYYDNESLSIKKQIKVGGGGRPGHSSDVDAIKAAEQCGAKKIISLKNVDYVYDKDPSKYEDAKKQEALIWQEYLNIIDNKTEHEPGGNYPIDPVASRMAQKSGIEFCIIDYTDLQNFKNVLKGDTFNGTLVK